MCASYNDASKVYDLWHPKFINKSDIHEVHSIEKQMYTTYSTEHTKWLLFQHSNLLCSAAAAVYICHKTISIKCKSKVQLSDFLLLLLF